jgi:peroxiredoxin
MNSKIKALAILTGLLVVPVALLIWVYHISDNNRGVSAGQRFPPIHLSDLDGNEVRLEGKTLLVFFDVTCPSCQDQLVNLDELSRRYRSEHLRIVAASLDDTEATRTFIRQHQPSYSIVVDVEHAFATRLHGRIVPAFYLIDETGIVRYRRNGYRELRVDDRIVREFIGGSEVVDDNTDSF